MRKIAKQFSNTTNNLGMFGGIISALDGWLVKIKCPTQKQGGVTNLGSFYCRKGCCAINVQEICNWNKIIAWHSIKCRDSEHDSTAFKHSDLCKLLMKKTEVMINLGFCFLCDSAYCLQPFFLTPFDCAKYGTPEDVFNYHFLTSWILIECAFGKIDARWRFFWLPLRIFL